MKFIITLGMVLFLCASFSYAKGIQIPIGDILGRAISKTASKQRIYSTDSASVLSIEELRGCLLDKEKLDVESAKINKQEKEIIQKENQLLSIQKENDQLRKTAYMSEHVNSLNIRINDYNEKVVLLQQNQDMVTFKVDSYNQKVNAFKSKCGQKNYYQEDFDQVMAEKRK